MRTPRRRENNPQRVPSLGISDPISHVRVLKQDSSKEIDWDSYNDAQTKITNNIASGTSAKAGAIMMELNNKYSGKAPNVVKINSGGEAQGLLPSKPLSNKKRKKGKNRPDMTGIEDAEIK